MLRLSSVAVLNAHAPSSPNRIKASSCRRGRISRVLEFEGCRAVETSVSLERKACL